MRTGLPIVSAICCTFLLYGCGAAVSSTRVQTLSAADVQNGRNQGENYFLPRALLVARVIASPSRGLRVVVDQPDFVADNGASFAPPTGAAPDPRTCVSGSNQSGPFTLSHRITGFHKDTITIATERSLLNSVVADTEEQTTEALANLAKSVAALKAESALASDDEELLEVRFDPADCGEVASVNALIREMIDSEGAARLREMRSVAAQTSPLKNLLLPTSSRSDFTLGLSGFAPFRLPRTVNATADCTVGVCIPVQVPASLTVTVGGRRRESPILYLPNRSDPVAIPVSRSGFADVKTTLTLDHGILTKREIVRTSEVAAILLLPATLVGAYFDELSSTFKKRKTVLDDAEALRAAREASTKKAESGDLAVGAKLLEIPIPGMSVGGTAPAAALLEAAVPPDAQAPGGQAKSEITVRGSRETPQGDGRLDQPVAPKGSTNGKK